MWRSAPTSVALRVDFESTSLRSCSLVLLFVFLWRGEKINSACVFKYMGRKWMDLPIETLPFLSLGLSLCQVLSMCGACQGREELFPKYRTWISWSLIGGSNLHYLMFHDRLCSFLLPFLCLLLVSSSSWVRGWSTCLMSFQSCMFPMNTFKLTLPLSAHTKVSWESPQLLWFTLTRSSAFSIPPNMLALTFFFPLLSKSQFEPCVCQTFARVTEPDCSSSCFQLICSQSTWKSVLF